MNCPRCGSRIEEDSLFCGRCGEEIRIVKDFEPDIEGLADRIGQDMAEEVSQLNKDGDRAPDASEGLKSRRRLYAAALLLLVLALVCGGTALFCYWDPQYQSRRAALCMQEADYERALPFARRAAALEENPGYLTDYALCLEALGGGEELEKVCLRILELEPGAKEAYRILIPIFEQRKEYRQISLLLQECPDEGIVSQFAAYTARPPEFSYPAGVYDQLLSLKLIGNPGGTIYYTTDGSLPDENSPVYTSPLPLEAGNYRIRAVYVNEYGVSSQIAEASYCVDVTAPAPPAILPAAGEYASPTLIYVEAEEGCEVYYTTDGSKPDRDSARYSGPFPMPVGVTRFRFISYNAAGAAGEEAAATYSLKLHAALGIDAARNKLLIELKEAGVLQSLDGGVKNGTGHNVYHYRYAVTIEGIDFYLYREYYEDEAGNRTGTGTDYVVSIMDGSCYRVVREEPEKPAAAMAASEYSEEAAEAETDGEQLQEETQNPWSGLSLQNIDPGAAPENN